MNTEHPFLKTPSDKISHLETQFGTEAAITRIYRRLSQLMGEHLNLETLDAALHVVEKEVEEGKFKPQP